MQYTPNYDLKKPDYDDTADIADLNDNFEIIDDKLNDWKPSVVTINATTAMWSSGVLTLNSATIPGDQYGDVILSLPETATAAQVTAARKAAMVYKVGSQIAGSIQFTAEGTVPTITIPLRLTIIWK
jgi:hypothetical protein